MFKNLFKLTTIALLSLSFAVISCGSKDSKDNSKLNLADIVKYDGTYLGSKTCDKGKATCTWSYKFKKENQLDMYYAETYSDDDNDNYDDNDDDDDNSDFENFTMSATLDVSNIQKIKDNNYKIIAVPVVDNETNTNISFNILFSVSKDKNTITLSDKKSGPVDLKYQDK